MHTLARHLGLRQFLLTQAPAIGVSLVIAEVFFKFGSFTLECVAFLGTWYVADHVLSSMPWPDR